MKNVSVIIPVYNTKEYLPECLECILNQTISDIEIICVDDGSTDGSGSVLKEYVGKNNNIILIEQENAGQSAARNAALNVATGKYIYCMDSDDLLIATALEELWEISEKWQLDLLYFSGDTFYESLHLQQQRTDFYERYLRKGNYNEPIDGKQMLQQLYQNGDYIVSPCLVFMRREFLDENKLRFQEGIIHEDNLFCFSILLKAKRTYCMNEIYFYRRVHEESVMTRKEGAVNLIGYWTCLIKQIKLASHETWDEEGMQVVLGVFRGLLYHIKRLYNSIDEIERTIFLDACDPLDRLAFEAVLIADIEEENRLNKEKRIIENKNREELNDRNHELMCVRNSASFKLGRVITCIPRKVRTFLRVLKQCGWNGVIIVVKEKLTDRRV